jgi:DNA (cytosine-5)-methyltransferase 1
MNYYNENDPKAAAWLKELILHGIIPDGVVDERSITEIKSHELKEYTQCHFFAGIGGWPLALQLAGWPSNKPVWTLSCPCQPFSAAGLGAGVADERHLWPVAYELIRECQPPVVFGEQVASAAVIGSAAKSPKRSTRKETVPVWLDGIFADLEGAHYACGAGDIPAAGVSAPHIRQRLYWVAYANSGRREQCHTGIRTISVADTGRDTGGLGIANGAGREPWRVASQAAGQRDSAQSTSDLCGVADTDILRRSERERDSIGVCPTGSGHEGEESQPRRVAQETADCGTNGGLADTDKLDGDGAGYGTIHDCRKRQSDALQGQHDLRGLGNAEQPGLEGHARDGDNGDQSGRIDQSTVGPTPEAGVALPWDNYDIVHCTDGKARRFERQPQSLAHGVSSLLDALRLAGASESEIETAIETYPLAQSIQGRVGLLRGYGNAIAPPLAAEFIMASMEAIDKP